MAFPYVFLDATYCKARVNHRVVSQAIVVATGVAADGHREVLGFDVGDISLKTIGLGIFRCRIRPAATETHHAPNARGPFDGRV